MIGSWETGGDLKKKLYEIAISRPEIHGKNSEATK
jgi:hypothetical protein